MFISGLIFLNKNNNSKIIIKTAYLSIIIITSFCFIFLLIYYLIYSLKNNNMNNMNNTKMVRNNYR